MIVSTGGNVFTIAHEHKNGWNPEAFKERYSEVLDRYDYIVGDWGYSQLRLRGFYREGHPRATKETTIASLIDYLNEYCNFGCAYFVLSREEADAIPPGTLVIDLGETSQTTETAAESAASSEAPAVPTTETAAPVGNNGMLMRWPLKERPGGPVRVPGAAAVARAAQEAERRNQQQAQPAAGGKAGDARSSRQGGDGGGYGGRQSSRPHGGGGADMRSSGGQAGTAGNIADARSGGRPQLQRGPRPQGTERVPAGVGAGAGASSKAGAQGRSSESGRSSDAVHSADTGRERPEGSKNGSRWPGKNRRRNRFGGKPDRPGGAPRDGGSGPDSGHHSGE